ncbi:uncharacterized protein [Linepithema humile]|uniref:uncharacterized protein isoform X4 n=1 Tax=Linepithema humile TaxID=83485 RepID=UPI00351E5BF5
MHSNSASNLQNSANIWSVVEFVEQLHEIEVVPISWLVVLNKQKTLCKWPPKNPRKYIRNNIQPDSSWKEYRVQVLIQSDSYQKALNYAKKKSNSETDTSYYQLGKGKRRKKHKSQDVTDHSDSESTQRMTPPPSITIPHDTCTEETGEEESNYNKNIEDNTAIEEESDVNNNNGTPTEKTSDKVNKQRTQENNIAATPNRNEDYAMEDIIEELPTGGHTAQMQIKNGLEKMFTNKLGSKCSWFGRKGNYQLNSLYIMEILKNAVRKHFHTYTNRNFQDNVSTWFKYANTRRLREKAGQEKRQQNIDQNIDE